MKKANPVFKYMKVANKAHIFKDRKKRKKKGYTKHKSQQKCWDYLFGDMVMSISTVYRVN